MVQRQPDTPTIGNIPREARIPAIVVKLVEVNGKWREVRPGTPQRNATGHYDYVLKDGELWAVKRSAGVDQRAVDLYRRPPGHTEAAGGERVTYAGQVKFSNSGQVRWWNEATGHYLSATSLREPVIAAGFSKDKFVASEEVAAGKKGPSPKIGPQLPVFQPKTVPRGEGPVKVPPGPPRVEEFEARYRSSTKGSVFERGSALPKSVIETTGQPPLPKDSVFNIKTADAPAASSATTTGATTTSMKKGRVTVDVDPNAPGYKNMVRVRIDVSDLPPLPKTGGAGGMGPKMVKIALIGETMLGLYGEAAGGETKKNIEKIIDPIKSHFRGKLEDARVEFHSNYRAVSFLKQAAGLEDLRTAYEAAMKRTKIPEAQRAWLGIAIGMSVDNPKVSQEDLQRMVESYNSGQWAPTGAQLDKLEGARQGYEDAAYLVQDQIHQYDQKLMKAHAENIAKRAGILLDAGQSLSDTFWGLMQTVGSIPVVYYQLWSIYDKATLFMELGAGMSAFAGEIRGRAWEYEQAINALEKTLLDVGATRFKGLYREPRK